MGSNPDVMTLDGVLQVKHVECDVAFEYNYNGVYGYPSERCYAFLQGVDPLTLTKEEIIFVSKLFGKANLTKWFLMHGHHEIFTKLWNKV